MLTARSRYHKDRKPLQAGAAGPCTISASSVGLLPGVPVVSEEALPVGAAALGQTFVLVDPLDGTKK
jgi:3'-phosphoadenosine 5'-phosphosulfate (PAPS) 3'-phosphatase